MIFYADDDEDDLYIVREVVESLNWDIKTFINGLELLAELNSDKPLPKIIMLDVNMPSKNGMTVLKEIRDNPHTQDIAVVMFTTTASDITIEKCRELGADFYVVKPISYVNLNKALRTVIEMKWKDAPELGFLLQF